MKKSIAMGLLVLVAGCLQAIVSVKALAQADVLTEMDQDEDGMISIREAVADPVLLASFGKVDTDGDGKISAKELEAATILKKKNEQA
jgi:Ca2+-binding EF-hand superfamily protein